MSELDQLLRGLEVRDKNETPQNLFTKVLNRIGRFFNWKSAEVEFSATEAGVPIVKPRIEFDSRPSEAEPGPSVAVSSALHLLDTCLSEAGISAWVAVDRLDEAFQGFPQVEIPALRALLRTYLDMLEFPHVRLKLFLRRDLFRRITAGGFVNLTHVNARKIEVIWDEEDLLNLLCRRIRRNQDLTNALSISQAADNTVFHKIFPPQVDVGKRKPQTWTWIMRRIRDGNDIKPPRNLIDLISMAKQAQLRREDRESRDYSEGTPLIEGDSLRRALTQLSTQRVQDTLLAEAAAYAKLISRFRDGKAEHNAESLSKLLEVDVAAVRSTIEPLLEIGFLETIKGAVGETFKIPSLYRDGLNITQGKAFDAAGPDADEDEEE
jgi:hypothetical protein